MAKTKISEYDATAANNTDIDSINIAEGMAPSNVNNAIREMMAHLKDMDAGTHALTSPQLSSVDINGGTIDGVTIGGASAGAGSFTTINASSTVTANAGVAVDNITIDGTEIDLSSGDLTVDVAGDIILDADGGNWRFKDDGTTLFTFSQDSQNVVLFSAVSDKDLIFKGNDGGSTVTALTLDMSDAGTAIFNSQIQGASGAVSAPTFAFSNDSNTGMTRPTGDTLTLVTGGSEAVRVNSSQAVLIGTTSATPADANGVIAFGGSDAGIIYLQRQTGTDQLRFYTGGNRLGFVNTASSTLTLGTANFPLAFATNDAERMRVDTDGKLLCGTTHNSLFNTSTQSHCGVLVDGANDNIQVARHEGTPAFFNRLSTDGALIDFRKNGVSVGTISTASGATAYNTSSDQRLKDNIEDADDAGELIDAIQVRQFDWRSDGVHQRFGMVAQELHAIAPEAVSTPEDPDEMMGVDYSKLVPMLIKEVQTLRSRVAQLEKL